MRVLHLDSGRDLRGGQRQALALVEGMGADAALLARLPGMRPPTLAAVWAEAPQFDLLHAHDARSHTLAALAARGKPVVVSRRVAFPVKRGPLSRWKYGRADGYIAVSEFVKRQLIQAGIGEGRISVVYDGVRVPPTAASGGRIVAVRSGDPMKGSDLIAASGLDVHFSTDLERDLPEAAVFLYISRAEGLGSAALLAMAYGVPVVASRVGGLSEIVQDEVTGILTDNDPRAIASAVREALAAREELGRRGRERVLAAFTLEHMIANTRAVYRKVLGC